MSFAKPFLYGLGILVVIAILIGSVILYKKEHFVSYSGFRAVNRKNKNICLNYFLSKYRECIKNSGGVDFQGNCFSRIQPNLIQCYYTDY